MTMESPSSSSPSSSDTEPDCSSEGKRQKSKQEAPPAFRFFDLPPEIREKIFRFALVLNEPIDLGLNAVSYAKHFLVSKQFGNEATHVFYGSNTFRVLPTHPKAAARRAKPILRRLPRRYKGLITCAQLHLGPHWGKPPKCWTVDKSLGLEHLTALRKLDIYVQADPSHDMYEGFRVSRDFYTLLASSLLTEILAQLPALAEVRLDNDPSVSREGSLVTELWEVAETMAKKVTWGPKGLKRTYSDLLPLCNSSGFYPVYQ